MRDVLRVVSCAVLAIVPWAASCAFPQPSAVQVRDMDATAGLPLSPTRVLRFTTSEGTWMSVDVSPDGKTIVFDLLGDLYTLPMTGGPARRLTAGPAIDAQPRYAPDGSVIVFTSDRSGSENVWVIDADGSSPRPVTTERERNFQSPVWTPDADSVVVVRRTRFNDSASQLRIYPRTGGPGLDVTRDELVGPNDLWQGPAFGPHPRFLWHTRFERDTTAPRTHAPERARSVEQNQLALYDRLTGRDSLLAPIPGGRMRPVVSPDGRWLVYGTQREGRTALMLRDLSAGSEAVLVPEMTQSTPYVDETRDAMPGVAFTPDGRALVLTNHGKLWRVAVPSGEVTAIPFTADVEQRLGPLVRFTHRIDDSAYTVRQIRNARFSPDGTRLAFTAIDRLWVLDWPDGRPVRLTDRDRGERYPVWSPDGQYLAFVSWEDSSQAVYRVRSDGSAPAERLTHEPGHYHRLNYTPDGKRIVVSRTPLASPSTASTRVLVWLPATGGPAHVIGDRGSRIGDRRRRHKDGLPYVLPGDPTRVYHGGHSLRWDGGDRRTHVEDQYYRAVLSPDGRYALFDGREEDIVLIPLTGADSITSISVPAARHVTRQGGDFAGWSDDGRSFYYTLGTTVFRMALSCVEALSPRVEGFLDDGCEPERRDIVITVAPDRARGAIVLRGGKLVTMRGKEVIEDGDLLIRNGRIVSVGPRGHVEIPRDAHAVDVAGNVILPGLIDVHSHTLHYAKPVQDQALEYLVPLACGITTQRDPQSSTRMFGHADRQAVGYTLAPRMFPTGPGIGSANWSAAQRSRWWGNTMLSPDRTVDVLTRYARFHRTTLVKEYMIGDRRTRQWFNMAARELGLTVTSEGGRGDLKAAMSRMLDGYAGHEHFFAVTPLYEDMLRLMAASGIVYTPTLVYTGRGGLSAFEYYRGIYDVAGDPRRRHLPPTAVARLDGGSEGKQPVFVPYAKDLARIAAAGGRLAVGGHGEGKGRDVHFELWAMASGGLPVHTALRAATLGGAEALGLERDLGSLEPGKLADLVVLEDDPLEDIRNSISVRYVMQNGRLYDSNTLDELWPPQASAGAAMVDARVRFGANARCP